MTVLMLAGAEEDLDEAFAYYQSQQTSLGDDMLVEFRRAVDLILLHPGGWQRMDDL